MIETVILLIPLVLVVAVLMTVGMLVKSTIGGVVHRRFGQKDNFGKSVPLTRGAKLTGGLPFDVDFVAGRSAGAKAPQTLGLTILRPTIGLRVISIGISALFLVVVWMPPDPALDLGQTGALALSVMVAYAILTIAFYEARYDADTLEAPNWLFQRRGHRWSDLQSIKDNGHYLYVLRFDTGAKVEVQKHLVGIRDFLTIAQMHATVNRRS